MWNEAVIGTAVYALAWTAFGTAHSLLARETPKRVLRRRLGRATRLSWNLVALVQFALVVAVGRAVLPDISWSWPAAMTLAQFVLGMAGVAVLLASSRSYDMGRFAGITQLRGLGEADEEPFSARGPLAYIRHPLYAGSILIVLAMVQDLRSAETAAVRHSLYRDRLALRGSRTAAAPRPDLCRLPVQGSGAAAMARPRLAAPVL